MNLTNSTVRALPFTTKGGPSQKIYRDESLRGFLVVVGRKTKTWAVQVEPNRVDGERVTKGNRPTVGHFPDMDAGAARSIAMKLLDPERRPTPPNAITLQQAFERYKRDYLQGHASQRTIDFYETVVNVRLHDWLHKPLAEITRVMVSAKFEELSEQVKGDKPGSRKGGKYAANGAVRTFRAIYNFARRVVEGLPPESPTIAVRLHKEKRRNTAMAWEALPAWHKQRLALPNSMRAEFHFLTLLSGSRPDPLTRARWSEIDLKARRWRIPAPKGGEDRAFDVPLSKAMLASLERVRALGQMIDSTSDNVFVQVNAAGHITEHKERRSKLSHWGNDLRQTYVTAAMRLGVPDAMLKFLLNHSVGGDVTLGYGTRDKLFAALLKWQEKISAKLVG